MEGMEKPMPQKPQAELPPEVDLSGLSKEEIDNLDMSVFFPDETVSEIDNVQYVDQDAETDNDTVSFDETVQDVMKAADHAHVEFDMKDGRVIGKNLENEKVLHRIKKELEKKYTALVAKAQLGLEEQSQLNEKMLDLISDAEGQEELAQGNVDEKIETLLGTLEDYSNQIEIEAAMNTKLKH